MGGFAGSREREKGKFFTLRIFLLHVERNFRKHRKKTTFHHSDFKYLQYFMHIKKKLDHFVYTILYPFFLTTELHIVSISLCHL